MNNRENNAEKAPCKALKWKQSMLAYIAVWAACVLWFWLSMGGGGWIMVYTILSFGVILPITTLVIAFRLEWNQDLGYWRWGAIGFFSLMYVAAQWATFVLSTYLRVANISTPPPYTFLIGLCPGAIGIALGWMVRSRKMTLIVPVIGLYILLAVCYVILKTMNGSLFRLVLILDVPAVVLLILGIWLCIRTMRQNRQAD